MHEDENLLRESGKGNGVKRKTSNVLQKGFYLMSNEELVKQIRETGDQDNKLSLQLWEMNSGIIRTACNKFRGYIEFEDALQECYEPFTKAIKEYDPTTGMKFVTYCYNRCLWHLHRYMEECGLLIRVPGSRRALIRQYKKLCREYYQRHGAQPEDLYLCKELDISMDQLIQLRKDEGKANISSLDDPLTDNPEDSVIGDLVPDTSKDIEEEAMEVMYKAQRARALWGAVDALRPQHGQAIRLHYKDGKTYAEVGKAMGTSTERVRQVVAEGIRELRRGRYYKVLREFADMSSTYSIGISGGLSTFNHTWTSSTERAALINVRLKEERQANIERLMAIRREMLEIGHLGK